MFRAKRFSAVLLALAVASLVGCGESDPTGLAGNGGGGGGGGGGGSGGGTPVGAFEATVTGAANLDLDGEALWGEIDDATAGDVFVILLGDTSSQVTGTVSLFLGGNRPGTGTYQIMDLNESAETPFVANEFVTLVTISQPALLGTSLSGEVTITSSSSEEVAGTFTVRAEAVGQGGGAGEVTVTGSFRAIGGPVFLP